MYRKESNLQMSEDVFENKTTTNLQSKEESEQNILTPDMRTTEVLPNLYSMLCWRVSEVKRLVSRYCLMKNAVR